MRYISKMQGMPTREASSHYYAALSLLSNIMIAANVISAKRFQKRLGPPPTRTRAECNKFPRAKFIPQRVIVVLNLRE